MDYQSSTFRPGGRGWSNGLWRRRSCGHRSRRSWVRTRVRILYLHIGSSGTCTCLNSVRTRRILFPMHHTCIQPCSRHPFESHRVNLMHCNELSLMLFTLSTICPIYYRYLQHDPIRRAMNDNLFSSIETTAVSMHNVDEHKMYL